MKLFIIALALVTSSLSMAARSGDWVQFNYSRTEGVNQYSGWYTRHVLNQCDKSYLISEQYHLEGFTDTTFEKVYNESEILSDAMIQTWLKDCEYNKGSYETLTLPTGEMQTCKVALHDEENLVEAWAWIGNVPLGIVKQTRSYVDGTSYTLELFSYNQQK